MGGWMDKWMDRRIVGKLMNQWEGGQMAAEYKNRCWVVY